MPGGASFISDQKVLQQDTTTGAMMHTGRARITSIQTKGHSNGSVAFHDVTSTGAIASGNKLVEYKFGTEGLDFYFPGSGVLFKSGIAVVLSNSGSTTISITG